MKKLAQQLNKLPETPGVYIMKNKEGNILYIGKAKNLRIRASSYFRSSAKHTPKISLMVSQVNNVEFIEQESELEALLLESRLIKELQPKYNTRQKDCKSYPYLIISKEDFPRVFIAREHDCQEPDKYKRYGPFVDAVGLKKSLKILQKIFQFRTCTLSIQLEKYRKRRPCLLAAIGYCSAACACRISKAKYNKDIKALERFLQGDRKKLLKQLNKEMDKAAQAWKYEQAANIRDRIKAIESLHRQSLASDFVPGEFLHQSPEESLKSLQEILKLADLPKIIEGVDIAHHGGKEAVGSIVTFRDGFPYKKGYRRYQIQGPCTNNDYFMIQEVLQRRFCGQDKDRELPDILLIDGGKGQLNAAQKILRRINVMPTALVSLAKKNEEIYIPGTTKALKLPKHSVAHHVLCYVRDEAHRFAQSYHHYLKSSEIKKKEKK